MSSTPESLTKKLPLWKKPGDIIKDSKDATIISEDKTILFQLLFALYVANSKYGINPNNVGNFKVKKEGKHTMIFALESGGDYDVFTFETEHHVVLDYPITLNETKKDLDTTSIANAFSSLLDKTPAGKLLKDQLGDSKQDYGTGLEWGPNLALFHPFFYSFYVGETATKPSIPNEMIYLHEPKWSKLDPGEIIVRSKKVDDIYAKGTTYTLEQFKDVITNLINLYKYTKTTPYKDDDVDYYKYTKEQLKSIYTKFREIYTEDKVEKMGDLSYFTKTSRKGIALAATFDTDYLIDEKNFNPSPSNSGFSTSEVGPRTRGYIGVFLSIIALVAKNDFYGDMSSVDKALAKGDPFNDTTYISIQNVFNQFDTYFNSAQNAINALKTEYSTLEATFNDYKKRIVFRKDKHPLKDDSLNKAKTQVDTLNASNLATNEAAVTQALAEAQKDEGEWKLQAEASESEQKRYDALKTKLETTQKAYNDAKTEYSKVDSSGYSKADPIWPDLKTLEDAKDASEFQTNAALFESALTAIETNQLKTLREELEKKKGANEFQIKVDEIKAIYDDIEKLRNDALAETTNYNNIWAAVTTPNLGINTLKEQIQKIQDAAQKIATKNGYSMNPITDFINQIDTWRTEVLTKASQVQRQVDGKDLDQAYNALGKEHKDIKDEIANFKNNSSADQKTLTDENARILKLINNRQTKDNQDAIEDEKKRIVVPIVVYSSKNPKATQYMEVVLSGDKKETKTLLKDTSTEFQSLIDQTDDLSKSRVTAGAIALGLDNKDSNKRKLLAFSQMFV